MLWMDAPFPPNLSSFAQWRFICHLHKVSVLCLSFLKHMSSALLTWGSWNKIPQAGCFRTTERYSLVGLEGRIWSQQGRVLLKAQGEDPSWAWRCITPIPASTSHGRPPSVSESKFPLSGKDTSPWIMAHPDPLGWHVSSVLPTKTIPKWGYTHRHQALALQLMFWEGRNSTHNTHQSFGEEGRDGRDTPWLWTVSPQKWYMLVLFTIYWPEYGPSIIAGEASEFRGAHGTQCDLLSRILVQLISSDPRMLWAHMRLDSFYITWNAWQGISCDPAEHIEGKDLRTKKRVYIICKTTPFLFGSLVHLNPENTKWQSTIWMQFADTLCVAYTIFKKCEQMSSFLEQPEDLTASGPIPTEH